MANITNLTTVMNYPAENLVLAPRGSVHGYNNIVGGYPAKIIGHFFWPKSSNEQTYAFRGILTANPTSALAANQIYYNKTNKNELIYQNGEWVAQQKENGFLMYLTSYIIIEGFEDQNYSYGEDTDWNPERYHVNDKIYIYTDPSDDNSVHEKIIKSVETVQVSTARTILVIELDTNIDYGTGSSFFDPFSLVHRFNYGALGNKYTLTNDITVTAGKIYYRLGSNNTYTIVTSPSGNPKSQGFYEAMYKAMLEVDLASTFNIGADLVAKISLSNPFTSEIYKDNDRMSSGVTTDYDQVNQKLRIIFSASQEADYYSKYEIRINANAMQSAAIIENKDFDYTTHIMGEYNTNTGCNTVTTGNGNTATGDFSVVNGLYNGVAAQNSDVDGVSNMVSNSTGAFVRGISNKVRKCRDVFVFGGTNEMNGADGSMQVGGLNKATGMNNLQIGQSNEAFGRMTVAVGARNINLADRTVNIGYNLVNKAFGATIIGANGELPLYKGDPINVTQAYSAGGGIWYRDAVAIAAGLGNSSGADKMEVPIIFSKYRYVRNVAYPYGPAGNKPSSASGVTGANGSKTNRELRDSTVEDPVVLTKYNQLSIDASLVVNGITFNDDTNVEHSSASGSVQLDRLVSSHYVIKPSASCTLNPVVLNMNNYDEITLIVQNGGTLFTFPSEWKNGGTTFTFTSSGYDVFTIKKLILGGTTYYVYRHEYQFN